MDLHPPAKRSRNDHDSKPEPHMLGDLGQPYPPFSRTSSEFWFDDGSIIIVCGDTGYRVHKGVLAFNSAVFKDMFALGDADPGCNEMLDGCVVVRLDDESDDMLKLLRALYSRKFARGKTLITFELLNSLLKLSTKYAFDELRSELIEHLILMFPSERTDYVQDKARTILPTDYDPAIAVEFGVSYNIPAIIPTACFEVALWSLPKLLDEPRATHSHGQPLQLSRPALRACLLARDTLRAAVESALDTRTLAHNPWTRTFHGCRVCGGWTDAERQAIERRYRALECNPFGCARVAAGAVDAEGARLCAACEGVLKAFDEEMKGRVWEALPGACGFRDWDAVRLAQAQAGC